MMACYKEAFRTEGLARKSAAVISARYRKRHTLRGHIAPYLCAGCGKWHLTSTKDKAR